MVTKTNNKEQENKVTYTVKVKSVRKVKDKRRYIFSASVNGVHIEGLALQEYTNKEGKENSMVCYPSVKGKDREGKEKYFNTVWFPVTAEMKDDIERQIGDLLESQEQ